MNPFNFLGDVHNQMLINPRSSEKDKKDQYFLKNQFEEVYADKNYFLVPSSGSSTDSTTSVKLIALHQEAVLNSADRVNTYFNLQLQGSKLNFGCVLPTFHVGGLGVYARAFLLRAPVFQTPWNVPTFRAWMKDYQIHILSLVPAQIFDIVQNSIEPASTLQIVFVGGSKLVPELRLQAQQLGWKIIETYGMTETGSMVAVNSSGTDEFELFPDVEIALEKDQLKIKCNSLMTCSLQLIGESVELKTLDHGWLQTADKVEISNGKQATFIKLLGRHSDFIKINSEGVSLASLRNIFVEDGKSALFALGHKRSEFEIVVAYEKSVTYAIVKEKVQRYNEKVRSFEKVKKLFPVEFIPKSELQKVKYKGLQEIIKGIKYESV